MIGHLGSRVSALLDGQLDPAETERAWAHVHACHACRDLVEREGWVKTRLAGLSFAGSTTAPDSLKGALLGGGLRQQVPAVPVGAGGLADRDPQRLRRTASIAAIGGGAIGAAVMGVIALGAAPADAPSIDRRAPVTQIGSSVPTPTPGPGTPGSLRRP